MRERDEETGRYSESYNQEDFISAILEADGMMSTGDIARTIGCNHDTAYKRLQRMEIENIVKSEKIGNTLVWRIPEE